MYKRIKRTKLGRTKTHREALLKNLLRSLFENGSLETTTVKAKALKEEAQKVVAKVNSGTKGDVNISKYIFRIFGNKELTKKVFEYGEKENTGVKIIKTRFRDGDMSEMSRVVLMGFKQEKGKKVFKEEKEEEKVESKEEKKLTPKNLTRDLGKSISGKVNIQKKERAKSRSGL
jgi:large subunit ribosomal protein L17